MMRQNNGSRSGGTQGQVPSPVQLTEEKCLKDNEGAIFALTNI